ncbi:type VII secretion protein EccE [Micromonospora sp. 15K316]|uniref:type VII secretion protein EccE n=1 Tax=Micromonospora sp. 15K316 TaxID=2530376 RepID=UPI0010524C11|nr:type VII secretion protein EccE [Micromonospora sp. 15K316]TDC31563.1 type VII secretion protein EccE [Micromonospora sp. 15K316]
MTTTSAPAQRRAARPGAGPLRSSAQSGTSPRVRAGQVVAAQVAAALPVAALGRGAGPLAGALLAAALLLPLAWLRIRGRWLFEWAGTALTHLTRRRELPAQASPAALLDLVDPGATVRPVELAGRPGAVLDDATGIVALLEVGDPDELLGDGRQPLPAPVALLPPATPDAPPLRIQLVLSTTPAPAVGGAAGTSYRQLTDGRLAGRERAVLAVRVLRADGWSPEELRVALSGAVRRVVRRLRPLEARPLGVAATLRMLADLAHLDGASVRERWTAVRVGGLHQATFRLERWPELVDDAAGRLVTRLFALPATVTTVALCAGPYGAAGTVNASPVVRLAAASPGALSLAAQALHRLLTDLGGQLHRLDGAHAGGLAATLPLALAGPSRTAPAAHLPELSLGDAGLMLGTNRQGRSLAVRLFRPESTRVLLVGGVHATQLVVLRALALGAQVVVQTTRPHLWEPFVRGAGTPDATVPLIPPGRPLPAGAGTPLRPLLLVRDVGPVPVDPQPGPPWRSTLVVREELTKADTDVLGRADLVVLQPLDAGEAALAGATLRLGDSAQWLTRMRDDMVAVINRRALRWARLSLTPVEAHLVGSPSRRGGRLPGHVGERPAGSPETHR